MLEYVGSLLRVGATTELLWEGSLKIEQKEISKIQGKVTERLREQEKNVSVNFLAFERMHQKASQQRQKKQ